MSKQKKDVAVGQFNKDLSNLFLRMCRVYGEIAGDVSWTQKLLNIGIRRLSVTPSLIPILKEKVRTIKI